MGSNESDSNDGVFSAYVHNSKAHALSRLSFHFHLICTSSHVIYMAKSALFQT